MPWLPVPLWFFISSSHDWDAFPSFLYLVVFWSNAVYLLAFLPDAVGYFSIQSSDTLDLPVWQHFFHYVGLFVPSSILWVSQRLLYACVFLVMDTDQVIALLFINLWTHKIRELWICLVVSISARFWLSTRCLMDCIQGMLDMCGNTLKGFQWPRVGCHRHCLGRNAECSAIHRRVLHK